MRFKLQLISLIAFSLILSSEALAAKKFLIFMPGYYGTTFYDKATGKKVWLNGKQTLLGDDDVTLAMAIPGVDIPEALNLEIGEILDEVKVVGYEYMAYGTTQDYLREIARQQNMHYEAVTFDWRRDPMHGVIALDKTIQSLKTSPEDEFYLVAHSLGAVIASYYIRYGAVDYDQAVENWSGLHQFKKIVMVAAPYRGTMGFFRTMFSGLPRGLNRDLLSARTVSTLESSYYLLPPAGHDLMLNENFNAISMNLQNPQTWVQNGWGLFYKRNKFSKKSEAARFSFLSKTLSRAAKFNALVTSTPMTVAPITPTLYIKGGSLKTPDRGVWLEPKRRPDFFAFSISSIRRFLPDLRALPAALETVGDGTLPDRSTEPVPLLSALGAEIVKTNYEHLEVLHAGSTQSKVREFLQ